MAPVRMELSAKERDRLKVLHEVERGYLKRAQAARCMHLQVRLRGQGDGVEVKDRIQISGRAVGQKQGVRRSVLRIKNQLTRPLN